MDYAAQATAARLYQPKVIQVCAPWGGDLHSRDELFRRMNGGLMETVHSGALAVTSTRARTVQRRTCYTLHATRGGLCSLA
jgi:hypothetical protein